MKLDRHIASFIFIALSFSAFGQVNDARVPQTSPQGISYEIKKKNAIYLEALGNGVFYSVNYDRILFNQKQSAIGIRVGYSYVPLFNFSDGFFGSVNQVPVELNFIYTQKKLFEKLGIREELGIGATYQRSVDNTNSDFPDMHKYCLGFLRIGIRYQRTNAGWFYRIAFTPNIYSIDDDANPNGAFYFFPYGGISFGRSF